MTRKLCAIGVDHHEVRVDGEQQRDGEEIAERAEHVALRVVDRVEDRRAGESDLHAHEVAGETRRADEKRRAESERESDERLADERLGRDLRNAPCVVRERERLQQDAVSSTMIAVFTRDRHGFAENTGAISTNPATRAEQQHEGLAVSRGRRDRSTRGDRRARRAVQRRRYEESEGEIA